MTPERRLGIRSALSVANWFSSGALAPEGRSASAAARRRAQERAGPQCAAVVPALARWRPSSPGVAPPRRSPTAACSSEAMAACGLPSSSCPVGFGDTSGGSLLRGGRGCRHEAVVDHPRSIPCVCLRVRHGCLLWEEDSGGDQLLLSALAVNSGGQLRGSTTATQALLPPRRQSRYFGRCSKKLAQHWPTSVRVGPFFGRC